MQIEEVDAAARCQQGQTSYIMTLEQENNALKQQNIALQEVCFYSKQHGVALKTEHDTLEHQHVALQKEHDALKSWVNALQNEYCACKEQHEIEMLGQLFQQYGEIMPFNQDICT